MKTFLTYTILITTLLAFTTCKKDAKLQKLIIGTWEVKSKDRLVATDYPDHLSTKFTFKEDGSVIEQDCNSRGDWVLLSGGGVLAANRKYPCTTKYKIENRNLYIEYQVDSAVYEWYEVEIKSLTSNRMVIYDPKDGNSGEGVKWTYKKIN
jgi:hypothetical protein